MFCTICFAPMRFPRVKAEGRSFYHCVSGIVLGHSDAISWKEVSRQYRKYLPQFHSRILSLSLLSDLSLFVPSRTKKVIPMVNNGTRIQEGDKKSRSNRNSNRMQNQESLIIFQLHPFHAI